MSKDKFPTGTEPVPHDDDASTLQADASSLNLKTDTRQANWRRANPEKYLAHVAVQRALASGELVKGVCEVCGDPAVDGHHDDYSKPLEVRWLCRQHHIRLHGGGEDLFGGWEMLPIGETPAASEMSTSVDKSPAENVQRVGQIAG